VGHPETFDRELASHGEPATHVPDVGGDDASAEVLVRESTPNEANRLRSISRRGQLPVQAPAGDDPVGVCERACRRRRAHLVRTDESHVRKVIHAFSEEGFSSLDLTTEAGARRRRRPKSAIGWS
jgi:hypothetical protein